MIYCQNCGKELDETKLRFCPNCGRPITAVQPDFENKQPIYTAFNMSAGLPMNWFRFLIYFGLFAGATYNLIYGLIAIFRPAFYMYKILELFYGFSLLGFAGLAILARFSLAAYKKSGPKLLLLLYASILAFNFTYNLIISISFGYNAVFSFDAIISYLVSAGMVFLNNIYFTKRASLFNN